MTALIAIAQPPLSPAARQPRDEAIHKIGLFDWLFGGQQRDARSRRRQRNLRTVTQYGARDGRAHGTQALIGHSAYGCATVSISRSVLRRRAIGSPMTPPGASSNARHAHACSSIATRESWPRTWWISRESLTQSCPKLSLSGELRGRLHLSWQPMGCGIRLPGIKPTRPPRRQPLMQPQRPRKGRWSSSNSWPSHIAAVDRTHGVIARTRTETASPTADVHCHQSAC